MTAARDDKQSPAAVADLSLEEFLAHAHAIEMDAWERYQDIADQMEVHHNLEVAALFRRLGEYERRHATEIEKRMAGMDIPHLAPWEFAWNGLESPETADQQEVHYRMKPYHALRLALGCEQRAYRFFDTQARQASDEQVRELAREYADEELRHVDMVKGLLAKQPVPAEDWAEDWDPAAPQE